MNILNLIATNNFITVNRTIASIVGLEAAVVLGELASEATYWSEHNPEYDGSFYSTIENLEARTYLSAHSQRLALNKLQEQGWVTVEKRGMPAKRYIRIHEEEIAGVVNDKSLKFLTTRDQKNERQVVKIFNTNNNKNKENRKEEKNKGDSRPAVVNDSNDEEPTFPDKPITKKDLDRMIDILTTACPWIKKQISKELTASLWMEEFKGTKASILYEALRNHISTNSYYPTIKEIKDQIRRAELTTGSTAAKKIEIQDNEIPEAVRDFFKE
jgi:hypothetical protein